MDCVIFDCGYKLVFVGVMTTDRLCLRRCLELKFVCVYYL